jgi:Tfp pilus assembly protein PilO
MKNIISIIVIVVSIASFIFFVKPEYAKVKEIEIKNVELREVNENAKKLRALRDGLLEKQKELSQMDINRLEKLIPESADNVKLIIDFQNIADKYNLTVETASSKKDDGEKGKVKKATQSFDIQSKDYGIISLNFSVIGSYDGFLSFLEDVEDSLRISDLRSLSFEPISDSTDYQFNVTVDTYWLKDNI